MTARQPGGRTRRPRRPAAAPPAAATTIRRFACPPDRVMRSNSSPPSWPAVAHHRRVGLLAAVACLALAGCGGSPGPADTGATFTLMQMNLCLSGLAGCYGKVAYPAVVEETVARIGEAHPDAVTFDEACRNDVTRIARRTGYHARFSRVIYRGERLRCVRPGGRGLFGDAVLTTAAIESSDSQEFEAQAGIERRRWLCAATRVDVDVCTAHLNTRSTT